MCHQDMISVFNQLTRPELADCTLFENILECHYEKFKYFYSIIEDLSLEHVQKIECIEDSMKLLVFIQFKGKKDRDTFELLLNGQSELIAQYEYSKFFIVNIEKDKNKLNISIENNNIYREEEIYEDRSDTN